MHNFGVAPAENGRSLNEPDGIRLAFVSRMMYVIGTHHPNIGEAIMGPMSR